jgi:hypothetical protein
MVAIAQDHIVNVLDGDVLPALISVQDRLR